jgi:plastocyanin
MFDYRFAPSLLKFRVDICYRLHVVNRGKELHELTGPDFLKAVTLGNPKALTPDLAVEPGEAEDLYFPATRPGRFQFWCADHDWAGMVGKVRIE